MSEARPDGATESADDKTEAAADPRPPFAQQMRTAPRPRAATLDEQDPFAGNAEDIAAHETRRKNELSAWADTVLGLSERRVGVGTRRTQ